MYFLMVSSSNPTVLTQYPRDQKFNPVTRLFHKTSLWMRTALFPFRKPITKEILNFGGTLKHIRIWSGIRCPSNNSIRFCLHKSRVIPPIRFRTFPYITLLRNLGIIMIWYLQSHLTCDKLCQSYIGSSSCLPAPSGLHRRKNLQHFSPDRYNLSGSTAKSGGFNYY